MAVLECLERSSRWIPRSSILAGAMGKEASVCLPTRPIGAGARPCRQPWYPTLDCSPRTGQSWDAVIAGIAKELAVPLTAAQSDRRPWPSSAEEPGHGPADLNIDGRKGGYDHPIMRFSDFSTDTCITSLRCQILLAAFFLWARRFGSLSHFRLTC